MTALAWLKRQWRYIVIAVMLVMIEILTYWAYGDWRVISLSLAHFAVAGLAAWLLRGTLRTQQRPTGAEDDLPFGLKMGVTYQAHVAGADWTEWVRDGAVAGPSDRSKRLEAVRVRLPNAASGASVTYQAHVQHEGWMDWVADWATAGTTNQALRLEALRIVLVNAPTGYSII